MSTPAPLDDLVTVLNYSLQDNPVIHNNIIKMFLVENPEETPEEQVALAKTRLEVARKLFQGIAFNADTPAIFYRLEDKNPLVKLYAKSSDRLRDKFKKYLKEQTKPPSKEILSLFLEDLRKNLSEISEIQKTQEEKSESKISTYMINLLQSSNPKISTAVEINEWFASLNNPVQNLALSEFYGVPDSVEACNIGRIYNPIDVASGREIHNWGVNAAWAIGVALKKLPINIQADLNQRSGERTKVDRKGNPSAFALEIAITVKMGYGLNIENNIIKLIPPQTLNDYRTNGIPGNGILPTKEEQSSIYQQCVQARELHTMLSLNGGENLRKHILDVCSSVDTNAKLDFIRALELLHRGNSLKPILNALQEREHKYLLELLQSTPSSNNLAETVSSYVNGNQDGESKNKDSRENSSVKFYEDPTEGLSDVELQQQSDLTAIFRSYQELQKTNISESYSPETTQMHNRSIASSAVTSQKDEDVKIINEENENKTKSDNSSLSNKKSSP